MRKRPDFTTVATMKSAWENREDRHLILLNQEPLGTGFYGHKHSSG